MPVGSSPILISRGDRRKGNDRKGESCRKCRTKTRSHLDPIPPNPVKQFGEDQIRSRRSTSGFNFVGHGPKLGTKLGTKTSIAISFKVGIRQNDLMTNATSNLIQHPRPIQTRTNPTTVTGPLPILKIGEVPIGFPVVQAALSGYSDGPMRITARRLGASYTLAEVMIDRFVLDLKQRHRTRRHLRVTDEEHPVGGQLMGSDPTSFGPAAEKLVEAGFDVIDINFGCPVKSTAGSCRGLFVRPTGSGNGDRQPHTGSGSI